MILDEVAHTGKTLQNILEYYRMLTQSVRIGVLHIKPKYLIEGFVPDYYVVEENRWIIYPWEVIETLGKIIRRMDEEGIPHEEIVRELMNVGIEKRELEEFLRISHSNKTQIRKTRKLIQRILPQFLL